MFENINSFSFYMATDHRLLAPMPCIYLVFLVCYFHCYKILSFGHEWYCHCIQMCRYLGCHFFAPIFFGYQSIPRLGPDRNVRSGHTRCLLVAETWEFQSQKRDITVLSFTVFRQRWLFYFSCLACFFYSCFPFPFS